MIKKLLLFCLYFLFLAITGSVYGQESDFGLWYVVNVEKSFNKKFDIGGSFNVRTFDNASTVDKAFLELEASYDLNKYLGFAGSYRIGKSLENDDLYHLGQQLFADIKGSLPVSHFEFSARLRFQMTDINYVKNETEKKAEYDGRFKLKGEYKIPDFPVNPYLSIETFTPLFRNSDILIEKTRSTIGLEYKITKNHSVDTEYTYQRDTYPNLSISHIVTFSYTFKF